MHSSITYNIFCTLAKCIVLKNTYIYSTCNNTGMFTFITCSLFVLHPPKCTCFVKNWDSYINAASISFILFKITKLKNVRWTFSFCQVRKQRNLYEKYPFVCWKPLHLFWHRFTAVHRNTLGVNGRFTSQVLVNIPAQFKENRRFEAEI